MAFAENLRELLDYKGIELKELSAGTGISKNTLDNYLSGQKSLPNIENGVKIARFLGVSAEYLVEGTFKTNNNINKNEALFKKILNLDSQNFLAISTIINSLTKTT